VTKFRARSLSEENFVFSGRHWVPLSGKDPK